VAGQSDAPTSVPPTVSGAPGSSVAPVASSDPEVSTVPLPTLDPAIARALQRIVDGSRKRIPSPGLSVAVRLADGTTWTGVSGDRQLSPPRPVEPDTVFAIASITKTFVTAAVLQLVEEGRLSLDDPLSRFVPDFPRAGRVTIRQLLGHTSGIHDYFTSPTYLRQVFADRSRGWTADQILDLAGAPYCQPGRCFHYSNTNFVLLGLVIEEVAGRPLSRVIRERLLDPLGLERTVFQPDERTPRDAAHGHLWAGGSSFVDHTLRSRVLPHRSASTVAWAAGAMASTAYDLARWAQALYAGDVVSEASRAEMLTFRRRDEYGLGTRTRDFAGYRAVGHLGGIRGYELAMWYFPEQGASIVVLSNRGIYSTDRTVRMLARSLFTRLEGSGAPPDPDASAPPVASGTPDASPVPSPSPSPSAAA
jgi:D-alanyl-D-alanine carboxypeptidase